MTDKLDGLSMDLEATNKDKLQSVFPECFTEGRLDIDKLLSLCGEYVTDDFEKYEFKWKGKSDCLRLAQKRSTATLRPCPAESVNFDTTQNLYIEGDNLEVLKLLQKSYFRKVKMIYIDPPYNTGNDFVYEDDFADPLARYKEVTEQTTKSNPETMGRYHTNWLNMMYPRLRLAANLLRDDGVFCISIDDNEVANLRKLCDEIFGEENFEGHIHWRRRHNQPNDKKKMIGIVAEHIIVYAKNSEALKITGVGKINLTGKFSNPDNDLRGDWASKPWKVASDQSGSRYIIVSPTGKEYNEEWMGDESSYKALLDDNRIIFPKDGDGKPRKKYFKYEREEEGQCATNWWKHEQFGHNQGANDLMTSLFGVKNVFSNPKPLELIRGLIQISNVKDEDIVFDFFSGSATTAHAVMQLNAEDGGNRRFIMVQLPEVCDEKSEAVKAGYKNICEIGKERIRRAGKNILAADDGQMTIAGEKTPLDIGFKVFKLASSNMKLWDDTPIGDNDIDALLKRIEGHIDGLRADRSNEDLVYEIMLKMGYELTCNVTALDVNGLTVYNISDGKMLICLQPGITAEHIEQMASFTPQKIVIAENALADNSAMANAFYLLENKGIDLKTV